MGGADIQDPKKQGHFTQIHNAILELLALSKFTQHEFKCLIFLLRNTYGRNGQKEAAIAISEWCAGTDIDRRNIGKVLNRLVERNIITKREGSAGRGKKAIWGFNKYYERWIDVSEKVYEYTPYWLRGSQKISYDHTTFNGSEKSYTGTTFNEKKSYARMTEKSYAHTPSKESKEKAAASVPTSSQSDDAMALVANCYHATGAFAKSRETEQGKADLAIADELIEQYGWRSCNEAIAKISERNQNGKRIRAPVSYLKTVLSDYEPVPAAQTDFSMEDIADV